MAGRDIMDVVRGAWDYSLFDALFHRRSRRVSLGNGAPGDFTPFESTAQPVPLSELEEALLTVAGTGVTGRALVDGAYTRPDATASWSGSTYLKFSGRPFPSPCNAQSTELFYTNDSGTFMVKQRGAEASRMREAESASDFDRLLGRFRASRVKVGDGRLEFPRAMPVVPPINQWNVNLPGTTLFMPVTDVTIEYINLLMTVFDSNVGRYIYDDYAGTEPLAEFADRGLLNRSFAMPLSAFEQTVALWTAGAEQALMCQNMFLTLQAMGLGGWILSAPSYVALTRAMGFRFEQADKPGPLKTPAWQPAGPGQPVGLDGHFESRRPPYYPSMAAAVQSVFDEKFGGAGTYREGKVAPYRGAQPSGGTIKQHDAHSVDAAMALTTYIWETYGRFPLTLSPVAMTICFQAHHLETEYYDKYYPPGSYPEAARTHMADWHGHDHGHDH
jgi:hypothetical protein